MAKPIKFEFTYDNSTTHKVEVQLFKTRALMRRWLTLHGHKGSANTDACCWQCNKPGFDNVVASICLAEDRLNLSTIIHESTHAAVHRVRLIGIPISHREFEEWLATMTGNVSDYIVGKLTSLGIKVSFECLPKVMVPLPYGNGVKNDKL